MQASKEVRRTGRARHRLGYRRPGYRGCQRGRVTALRVMIALAPAAHDNAPTLSERLALCERLASGHTLGA